MKHAFPIVALVFYAVATVLYACLFLRRDSKYIKSSRVAFLLGLINHAIFIVLSFSSESGETYQGQAHPNTLSIVSILVAATFILAEQKFKLSMLGIIAAPLAFCFLFASAIIFHTSRDTSVLAVHEPILISHLVTCILSLVSFAIGFIFACGVIIKEWALRRRKVTLFHEKLPALENLEKYSSTTIKYGFWLMVVGIVTGSFAAIDSGLELFFIDLKFLWSVFTLAIYASLIIARDHWGFRGARASWMAVAGFATVILSLVFLNISGSSFHVY